MMYEAAILKLKAMNLYYASIDFTTNIYSHTDTVSKVRLYAARQEGEPGIFTEYHRDFAGAFAELEKALDGELPEPTDEAPAGDSL